MSVLVEDNRITVEPEEVSLVDFLEYAELAIRRYGWRQGPRKKVTEDKMIEVAEKDGLSLHDAIGYTNTVLGGEEPGREGSKDASTRDRTGYRTMRNEMTAAVNKVLPEGQDDKNFNDKAKSVDEVYAVLRKAKEAAVA